MAGDADARAALVADHGRLVWSLCHRLADDPEDAAQASWERILRGLDRFDPDGPASLSTWIVTVTHRVLVDRHRRGRVRGQVLALAELPERGSAPDAALDQRRREVRLEHALASLPADQRRVVLLYHLHGVSLADIASGEGVPLGTVKSRLHRARGRLTELLTDPPEVP